MNGELFEEWAKEVDKRFQRECCHDNGKCSVHPDVERLKAIELKSFPANTTSNTQPMDQGIITSLKAKYRHLSVRLIIRYLDNEKPLPTTSILDAMIMLAKAWNAVEEKTIVNCSRKAGISPGAQSSAVNDDATHLNILKLKMIRWLIYSMILMYYVNLIQILLQMMQMLRN